MGMLSIKHGDLPRKKGINQQQAWGYFMRIRWGWYSSSMAGVESQGFAAQFLHAKGMWAVSEHFQLVYCHFCLGWSNSICLVLAPYMWCWHVSFFCWPRGNRLCSLCREGIAATEMSVTLVSCSHQNWPDICIRSSLLCENLPAGFKFYGKPTVDISKGTAMLQAAYQDENGQILLVRAWHRLCKDDGRGDVELSCNVGDTNSGEPKQDTQDTSLDSWWVLVLDGKMTSFWSLMDPKKNWTPFPSTTDLHVYNSPRCFICPKSLHLKCPSDARRIYIGVVCAQRGQKAFFLWSV
jgi:hypothetical protein